MPNPRGRPRRVPDVVDMEPGFHHISDEVGTAVFTSRCCGSFLAPSDPTRWYCVETRRWYEWLAASDLIGKGFRVYLPVEIKQPRRTARSRTPRPMHMLAIPRYLFLACDLAREPWRVAATAKGVARILSYHPEHPAPARRGVVERIIEEFEGKLIAREKRKGSGLAPLGARTAALVTDGPLAGHKGIVELSADDRVQLVLELFGGPRTVDLPRAAVVAA